MNKKGLVRIFCFVLIILLAVCIADHYRMYKNEPVFFSTWGRKYTPSVKSFSAVMCSAKKLYKNDEAAFLEIVIDDEKNTVKKIAVKDEKLIKKLSEAPLENIIGVNLISTIPGSAFEGKPENYKSDIIQLLIDYDEYDGYFEVADFSLAEK